ncbi:addiction module protein [Nannocystis sp. SCPEA4]|uniref:addiction module protein n=1 Tax=Nannocystis sp. SCPEA4 TaxID=2996787 RepID=UPI00226E0C73|nr:addiction module protein [Nannocystis sp. SCPEA4]MCY1053513.1 addiction module protein [Nannocystis sp. SCPEA4]
MTTDSFAGGPPRILTDADEVTLRKALKRRLAEIDSGEVEPLSIEEVWKDVFGTEAPPELVGPSR